MKANRTSGSRSAGRMTSSTPNMGLTDSQEDRRLLGAVDYYFIEEDGARFRVSMPYRPYLYLHIKQDQVEATMAFISKKYGQYITNMVKVQKEDLDLHNHLVGLK